MMFYVIGGIINLILFIILFFYIKEKIVESKGVFRGIINTIVAISLFLILSMLSYIAWASILNNHTTDISQIENTDERIKMIFDFGGETDFKKLSRDFKIKKSSMIQLWEQSYKELESVDEIKNEKTLNKLEQKISKSDDIGKKMELIMLKYSLEKQPMKTLMSDVIELLKSSETIDKQFYEKLYQIQMIHYDNSTQSLSTYLKNYTTDEQHNLFLQAIPAMREEYIRTTTNKNMLDKFSN